MLQNCKLLAFKSNDDKINAANLQDTKSDVLKGK